MFSCGVSRIAKSEIDCTESHSKGLDKSFFRAMGHCKMDTKARECTENTHIGLDVAFTESSLSLDADVRSDISDYVQCKAD